jgi:hypothetical protein
MSGAAGLPAVLLLGVVNGRVVSVVDSEAAGVEWLLADYDGSSSPAAALAHAARMAFTGRRRVVRLKLTDAADVLVAAGDAVYQDADGSPVLVYEPTELRLQPAALVPVEPMPSPVSADQLDGGPAEPGDDDQVPDDAADALAALTASGGPDIGQAELAGGDDRCAGCEGGIRAGDQVRPVDGDLWHSLCVDRLLDAQRASDDDGREEQRAAFGAGDQGGGE